MTNKQMTPEQAEAYVRERCRRVCIVKGAGKWGFYANGKYGHGGPLREHAVMELYAYTKERERNIAELKYELSLQRLMLGNFDRTPLSQRNPHDHDIDRDAIRRTIGRLEAQLAELLRGFKKEDK